MHEYLQRSMKTLSNSMPKKQCLASTEPLEWFSVPPVSPFVGFVKECVFARFIGMFNMDTPWLYLYAAHKLHQPQRSAYFAMIEFTAGKAFVVKGLVVEIFCKDKSDEKEGKVRIFTPTTTYLQVRYLVGVTEFFFEVHLLPSL